jgi:hypothetical protein
MPTMSLGALLVTLRHNSLSRERILTFTSPEFYHRHPITSENFETNPSIRIVSDPYWFVCHYNGLWVHTIARRLLSFVNHQHRYRSSYMIGRCEMVIWKIMEEIH